MKTDNTEPVPQPLTSRWWFTPVIFTLGLIMALTIVWQVSEVAREVLAKAIMTLFGAMATPFVLETSIALLGLCIVIAYNQWRLTKEGDGWVYLAQTEPDAASVATGAETPAQRLDGVIMTTPPDGGTDLNARLAMIEGYLDLGLTQEAQDHLHQLSADERQDPRALGIAGRLKG